MDHSAARRTTAHYILIVLGLTLLASTIIRGIADEFYSWDLLVGGLMLLIVGYFGYDVMQKTSKREDDSGAAKAKEAA